MKRRWRQEGLLVRQKRVKRRRIGTGENGIVRRRATRRNEVWGMDFVQDWTADGRPLRMLVVLDEYTRECLAIEVHRHLRGELLPSEIFDTLAEARYLIDRWRLFYNHRRIQRALAKVTPAAFAATCREDNGPFRSVDDVSSDETTRAGCSSGCRSPAFPSIGRAGTDKERKSHSSPTSCPTSCPLPRRCRRSDRVQA
jgi:hypothetical protein